MKKAFIAILLLLGQNSVVSAREPPCVNALDAMPESWRPSAEMRMNLSDKPWSPTEAQDAQDAIATGINEMLEHYALSPKKVTALRDDAVESAAETEIPRQTRRTHNGKVKFALRFSLRDRVA